MTDKQRKFVDEYLVDCNATQAAIRAGYSQKTAKQIGQENLTKPDLKSYIDEQLGKISCEKIADATEVLEYLTSVMRREKKENIVVTLTQENSKYVKDENGRPRKQTVKEEIARVVEIPSKLSDANKAAELIGKRYGIFTEKMNITGAVPVVISGEDSLED